MTTSTDATESISLRETAQLFEGRTVIAHLLFVAGSILLWAGVFAVVLPALFGADAAASNAPGGYHARLLSGAIASMVVGVYYGVGFLKGFGGPFWDFVLPGLVAVPAPSIAMPRITDSQPEGVYTTNAADYLGDPEVLIPSLPGVMTFLIAVWAYQRLFWSASDWQHWADVHLPEDTFIDFHSDPEGE